MLMESGPLATEGCRVGMRLVGATDLPREQLVRALICVGNVGATHSI